MNWLYFPTVALALFCFWLGQEAMRNTRDKMARAGLFFLFGLLALPGLLYSLYYFHLFDNRVWFYDLRSLAYSELLASFCGLAAGALSALFASRQLFSRSFIIALLCLGLFVPYCKPLFAPLPQSSFQETWRDGICIQSTASSCGAASAATLFKAQGISISEAELARECFTYSGGTESWYLCRAFRSRGFNVSFVNAEPPLDPIPYPSVAGASYGGSGHFIPILGKEGEHYLTGDPLRGAASYTLMELHREYAFSGLFMVIRKN